MSVTSQDSETASTVAENGEHIGMTADDSAAVVGRAAAAMIVGDTTAAAAELPAGETPEERKLRETVPQEYKASQAMASEFERIEKLVEKVSNNTIDLKPSVDIIALSSGVPATFYTFNHDGRPSIRSTGFLHMYRDMEDTRSIPAVHANMRQDLLMNLYRIGISRQLYVWCVEAKTPEGVAIGVNTCFTQANPLLVSHYTKKGSLMPLPLSVYCFRASDQWTLFKDYVGSHGLLNVASLPNDPPKNLNEVVVTSLVDSDIDVDTAEKKYGYSTRDGYTTYDLLRRAKEQKEEQDRADARNHGQTTIAGEVQKK